MKSASNITFGDEMWAAVNILNYLTGKNMDNIFVLFEKMTNCSRK